MNRKRMHVRRARGDLVDLVAIAGVAVLGVVLVLILPEPVAARMDRHAASAGAFLLLGFGGGAVVGFLAVSKHVRVLTPRSEVEAPLTQLEAIRHELTGLNLDKDPRSIEQMILEDDYVDVKVQQAERDEDAGETMITWGGVHDRWLTGPEVKAGDTVRIYGSGTPGSKHHGWALNGKLVHWATPWERFAERVRALAAHDRYKRERFAREQQDLDARVAALPAPLKARIERLRAEDPTFRLNREAYEMAAAGDAPKIARAIAAVRGWHLNDDLKAQGVTGPEIEQVIEAFYDLPNDKQDEMVPDLEQGHSGTTFGGAVALARALLAGDEL